MPLPGDVLIELCRAAQSEVILAAPFIKSSTMESILNAIPEKITSVKCVTRWRPEEVVAGVSDLEVFDLFSKRPGGELLIQPLLHAKYFRVDDNCLVGSANLTNRALGWATPSNMELMVSLPKSTSALEEFEHVLLSAAMRATKNLKEEIAAVVAAMEEAGDKYVMSELNIGKELTSFSQKHWLPQCGSPQLLYKIYSGKKADGIISWTLKTGKQDLSHLNIPPGFSERTFNEYVATLMRQLPIVIELNAEAHKSITPSKGEKFISPHISEEPPNYDAEQQWKALCKWLLFFLKEEYRQPSGTSDIQRGTEIGHIDV